MLKAPAAKTTLMGLKKTIIVHGMYELFIRLRIMVTPLGDDIPARKHGNFKLSLAVFGRSRTTHYSLTMTTQQVVKLCACLFLCLWYPIQAYGTTHSNFDVDLISHLGDKISQYIPVGVIVLSDGTIIIAAHGSYNFSSNPNQTYISANTPTNSTASLIIIHRISTSSKQIKYSINSIIKLGYYSKGEINDICSNKHHNNFLIIGNFGLYTFNYHTTNKSVSLHWHHPPRIYNSTMCHENDCKCDIGDDSTSIVFLGDDIPDGIQIVDWNENVLNKHDPFRNTIKSVAINTDDQIYYFTGEHQRTDYIYTAYVSVYDYGASDDNFLYEIYASTGDNIDIQNWPSWADTIGNDLIYDSENGQLFLVGEGKGYLNEFTYEPDSNLSVLAGSNVIFNDTYSTLTNLNTPTPDTPNLYTAVFSVADDGAILEESIWTLARRSNGNSNTLRFGGGFAMDNRLDEVYATQEAFYGIENRQGITVNNVTVGGYTGPDGALIIFNRNLTQRKYWTIFEAPPFAKTWSLDVSCNNGVMALVGYSEPTDSGLGGAVLEINAFSGTAQKSANASDTRSGFIVIRDRFYGDRIDTTDPSIAPTESPVDSISAMAIQLNVTLLVTTNSTNISEIEQYIVTVITNAIIVKLDNPEILSVEVITEDNGDGTLSVTCVIEMSSDEIDQTDLESEVQDAFDEAVVSGVKVDVIPRDNNINDDGTEWLGLSDKEIIYVLTGVIVGSCLIICALCYLVFLLRERMKLSVEKQLNEMTTTGGYNNYSSGVESIESPIPGEITSVPSNSAQSGETTKNIYTNTVQAPPDVNVSRQDSEKMYYHDERIGSDCSETKGNTKRHDRAISTQGGNV